MSIAQLSSPHRPRHNCASLSTCAHSR